MCDMVFGRMFRRVATGVRLVWLVLVFGAVGAVAGEALVRGDFEFDGMNGYLGWTRLYCKDGSSTVETLAEAGPDGKPAVRIEGKAARNAFYTTPLSLVSGEPYRLSAKVRTKGLASGRNMMLVTEKSWGSMFKTEIPADTAGKWVAVEAVGKAPAVKGSKPIFHFGFEACDFPDGAYLDICDPKLEPQSEKARKGSAPLGAKTPLIGRIVPVEPLLTEVDAETGFIRFLPNVRTNGCELVATVDGRPLGPIAEGRHEVNVKLVETATGKVRCENTYPFIARRRKAASAVGRKLNNFVTEVVNTELKDGTYAFENPRFGQVFIGFDKPYKKTKAYLDGIREPVVVYRRDEPSETIRTLVPGTYKLRVEGATGGRLRIHLVKPLFVNGDMMRLARSDIHSENPLLGWDFFRKCILPSCGQVELALNSAEHWPEARKARILPELLARGKVLAARTGIGPTRHEELADRAFIRSLLRGWKPYQDGYQMIWDEFGLHSSARDLNIAGEEMWALTNEMKPHGVHTDFFSINGRELKDFAPIVALISAIINSGRGTGMLMSESYLHAVPNVADLDREIDNIVVNQRRLSQMMPEAGKRIIHLLNGFLGVGGWTSHIVPEVDEKALLDRWIHRMATDPDFADVGGLSTTVPYGGEEMLRWHAALMHHYGVLGRTDSMTGARGWAYRPETVRDGDFNEGFAHWTIVEAEPGSVTNLSRKGFARDVQKRCHVEISGTRFALFTRSAKGPNKVIQNIRNLKAGEWYVVEFASSVYANVLAPRSAYDREPQLWARVKGMPFDERYTGDSLYPRGANNWALPKKACPVRTSRRVFKATAETAELEISDWKSDVEPGGPIGRRATLNNISVNPYFLPAGTELVPQGDYCVTDFGAKGDGKTLNTAALQAALDACARTGGTVTVPKGVYLTGTLKIGDDTELHLEKDAVLLGSPSLSDYGPDDIYPGSHGSVNEGWSAKHLIVAYGARNVSLTGPGAVDGNAAAFVGELDYRKGMSFPNWRKGFRVAKGDRKECNRPGQELVFVACENLRIEGVTLRNMNCWTCLIHGCVDVVVRNVKVRNDPAYSNTDGLDIDSSRNVLVEGCDIITGDDAFAIRGDNGKNLPANAPSRICENVLITNCVCESSSSSVRIGVGRGEIRDVAVVGLDVRFAGIGLHVHNCYGGRPQRGVDISRIRFSDVRIRNAGEAIVVTPYGIASQAKLSDVLFERIDATSFGPIEVSGGGETRPDGIVFRNVKFRMTPMPDNVFFPRPKPIVVENAGRVEFHDCDIEGDADEASAAARMEAREMARRAAHPAESLVKGFKPLMIEVTPEMAAKGRFFSTNYPVAFQPGRRYRVSYFVRGENIRPLIRGYGASSVAWFDITRYIVLGVTGYRMCGTFGRHLQTCEFDVPETFQPSSDSAVTLRLAYASGKAVFEDLLVEEVLSDKAGQHRPGKCALPAERTDGVSPCGEEKDVEYIAHQGEEFLAPGHSAAAYRFAVEHGLDYIKMDVRETKDGEIVLQHDRNLKDLFGCDWKIKEHTLADIRASCRYVAKGGRGPHYNDYTNATIQTLREGLKWGVQTKRGIWIDFKDFSPKFAEKVLAQVSEAGLPSSRVMVATWNQNALAYMKANHPEIRRVAHTYVRPKDEGYETNLAKGRKFENEDQLLEALLAAKDRLGLYGLNMPHSIVRKKQGVYKVIYDTPPKLVGRLQANGLWVSMWFINNAKAGQRWRTEGANAFVTNCKDNTRPAEGTRRQ